MPFPKDLDELRRDGCKFEGPGVCKSCNADMEWWTTPKGKKIPMNFGTATPHWATCPNADDFRK